MTPTPARFHAALSRMQGGRITPPTGLEVIVNDHCNISCRQCNHASPIQAKFNADPEAAGRDLAALARVYRPAYAKIIGGEPLLHPRLSDLLDAVRASGLTDRLILVTNGMLPKRMTPAIWARIDEVELSVYPGTGLDEAAVSAWRAAAAAAGRRIKVFEFPEFRMTFTKIRTEDDALVARIFDACKMAHVWGCHAYRDGRIFRCPQSIYIASLTGIAAQEGLAVQDAPEFADRLLNFLNAAEPLAACRHCVGSCGRKIDHALLPRQEWRDDLAMPAEAMLDRALLARSLQERNRIDDCKTAAARPGIAARLWRLAFAATPGR